MAVSFIALGANLAGRFASPAQAVEAAIRVLQVPEITLISRSRLYRSAAWPDPSDPEFINAVISVMTDLDASALLARLHALEAEFGRERRHANAPRTLDLDIVDYAGRIFYLAPGFTFLLRARWPGEQKNKDGEDRDSRERSASIEANPK